MVSFVYPQSKNHPLAPIHTFTKQIVLSLYQQSSTLVDIHNMSFPHAPYKLLPSFKKHFYMHVIFSNSNTFTFTTFHGLVGACMNPRSFFIYPFTCNYLSNISRFLMDFSQTCVSTSPMYTLPVILFSARRIHLFITLQFVSCHNLDPQQMICINF